MSILTLTNVGHSFGDFDLFSGITASIPNDAKIGLVGPNGIGKTTLLRILAGLEVSSSGTVTVSQGTRIGYLRQEAMEAFAGRENTVYAEMLSVFGDIKVQEAALQELEARMAAGGASMEGFDELLHTYSEAQQAFELAGGYEYETRIAQVLYGLGFEREEWHKPLAQLSGGQKTRALLARLLLEQPDLLILDEPTNHLDVEAIEWLEGTLRAWPGALLLVSHDRYFLDKVVDRIWEMSRAGIELYRGNYSAYVQQRQERWERREVEFQAIKERFLKELDYIKRNIARDATTNMAKGRLRRLVREVRVVQAGGLQSLLDKQWGQVMDEVSISEARWGVMEVEQAIKSLESPIRRPPKLNLRLKTTLRSGNLVLRSGPLEIGYPGNLLFRADPIQLERGECAALIGPNGTGKTTFLRTLMGQIEPLAGEIRFGASLKVGYFAQAHEKLNPDHTVLDELLSHKHMLLGQARNYLAQYLFRGDDVYKPVRLLSGGERGRLALALLALEGANFLLLDEPTNHLDIPAQEVLQEVLEQFDGTILLVSHDRYLIDRLATQIWELREGRLHVFAGPYAEYVAAREAAAEAARQNAAAQRVEARRNQGSDRQSKNEARRRERALAEMEEQVHRLEALLAQIEQDLQAASHAQDLARVQELSAAYAQTQATLEQSLDAWAELALTH
ncbi:MAG TPA: ABC-F family ATP-binding cassette domain-containing protein [Caldilineaceae bacterium]|nr:ABC-F family ATP-binding cassette domain-containing protein [Caldilineaceae bacterium]